MIINEIFKRPIISFGLGITMLSCDAGDEVTVWQDEMYNENEYILSENEMSEIITFNFTTLTTGPSVVYQKFFNVQGTYNGRPYYMDDENFFIFWQFTRWRIVINLDISNGTFVDTVGILNLDLLRPISEEWTLGIFTPTLIVPKSTTSNINTQGFTFTATESKSIEIEMVNKKTGQSIKSNTIELIVN